MKIARPSVAFKAVVLGAILAASLSPCRLIAASATAITTEGAGSADLSVTMVDTPNPVVTAVTNLTYMIMVGNAGPSSATTANLSDTLPAGTTFVSLSAPGGWSCTTPEVGDGGTIFCSSPSFAVGSAVFTLTVAVAPSVVTGTVLSNTATVSSASGDGTPGNNSATDTDTLAGQADIALAKSVDNAAPGMGSSVVFTITATNNGPSNATGVAVNDLLPVGLAFVSATPSAGSYVNAAGVWTIGSLANGASATLSITATVNRLQAMVNEANKIAAGEVDPRGNNNTAAVRLNGPPLVDIQVSQAVDDDTPAIGQDVFFLVTVKNAGPANATGVGVQSYTPLTPGDLTYVSSTPSQGTYSPGTGDWSVGSLASGASATLTVRMTTAVAGPIIRKAIRTVLNEEDLVLGNDEASVVLNPAMPQVDLSITKITMQGVATVGQSFSYVIVATNLSAGSATGVDVSDLLPPGVTLVSVASSQGSCTGGPPLQIVCNLGTLPGGSSATVNLVVTKTENGQVSNLATVFGDQADPNEINNVTRADTLPVTLMDFEIE